MTSLTRLGATLVIPSIFIGGWDVEANQRSRSIAWRTNKIGGIGLKMGGASQRLEEANQRSRSIAWRTNKIGGIGLKMGGASKRLEAYVDDKPDLDGLMDNTSLFLNKMELVDRPI
nr:hypothetical protein [Tanacetum cinerariifolium]